MRPQDKFYTLTRPLTRESFGLEAWIRHKPSSHLALNFLNEGWPKFELVTFCHAGFWFHIKESTQPKVMLMVEAPGFYILVLYTCSILLFYFCISACLSPPSGLIELPIMIFSCRAFVYNVSYIKILSPEDVQKLGKLRTETYS